MTAPFAAHFIVAAHHGQHTAFFNGGFECGEVDFAQGAFVRIRVDAITVPFRVVSRKVFHRCRDIVLL